MAQYIEKSALVAEIERRIKVSQDYAECNLTESTRIGNQSQLLELNDILSFLDTLEVKEVDLEKEIEKEWLNCDLCRENTILEYVNMDIKKFRTIVNHFFELGLKALVTGTGQTEEEAIQCFKNGYDDMKNYYAEEGKDFEEVEFDYVHDKS